MTKNKHTQLKFKKTMKWFEKFTLYMQEKIFIHSINIARLCYRCSSSYRMKTDLYKNSFFSSFYCSFFVSKFFFLFERRIENVNELSASYLCCSSSVHLSGLSMAKLLYYYIDWIEELKNVPCCTFKGRYMRIPKVKKGISQSNYIESPALVFVLISVYKWQNCRLLYRLLLFNRRTWIELI